MTGTLKRGSRGAAVRTLQLDLNSAGASPALIADSDFGAATERAVIAFQRGHGLVDDGIAGPQTKTALKQAITAPMPGRGEPDKSAMAQPAPSAPAAASTIAVPPPNAASLQLLATARAIDEIIWHCAATAEGKDFTVADIRAWHKQRGFSDIGYHYVVYRDGRIMLGRPVGQQGAHCADGGKNRGTIGCCYIGGVAADGKTPKDTRTAAQRASMLWLTRELARKHRGVRRVNGHNDYTNAKACPSFKVGKDDLGRAI
ncbi:peptidoglycan-binding protein [Bosea sp. TWI1241]|uniref:peptidoglycan-binding protein n=1 Tax=Bosea sp. TWI1241 TaxID=3148904 RepID=UPI0032083177